MNFSILLYSFLISLYNIVRYGSVLFGNLVLPKGL